MYFIENSRLIKCKNKALNNWSKHNFIFNKFSDLVVQKIGTFARPYHVVVVPELPKTRSGKILRGTMVKIANNEEFKLPATIDDPVILQEIKDALIKIGYAK